MSGLADRFRELRHAAAGGGPSGAEPAEMATDAIALALAAHAIVAYVGSILCPALLKSTRRVGLADIPPVSRRIPPPPPPCACLRTSGCLWRMGLC